MIFFFLLLKKKKKSNRDSQSRDRANDKRPASKMPRIKGALINSTASLIVL